MANGCTPTDATAGFDAQSRFVQAPGVLWRQAGGVVLVRTVANAEIVELFGTGVLLWLGLLQPVTVGELATDLAAVVGAPAEVVALDVRTALADLLHRGLVMERRAA